MSGDVSGRLHELAGRIARMVGGDEGGNLRTEIVSVLREHVDRTGGVDPAVHRALRRTQKRVRKLHEVAMQLEDAASEQEVWELGIKASESVLHLTASTIDVVEGQMLIPRVESSQLPEKGAHPISIHRGLIGLTYRNGRSYRVGNIQKHPEAEPAHPDYRSVVSVPIGDIGVFQCISTEEDYFDDDVPEVLEILALHLAAAVRRIRARRREERGRLEAERLASEYAVIFEGTQDGMFLAEVRDDGSIVMQRTNAALETMRDSGLPSGSSGAAARLFGLEASQEFGRQIRRCQRRAQPVSFDLELRPGEQQRYFSMRLSPVEKADGRVVQIVGSVCDRTAEKQAERALQDSEEKYRTLVENVNDAIFIIQNRRCVFANTAAGLLMNRTPEDLIGEDWVSMVHPAERGRVDRMARARARGEPVPSIYESALQDSTGSEVEVEFNINTVSFRGSSAYLISMRNIGKRKEVERRLRYLSFHDQLTDLYNRAYFENELDRLDVSRQLPLSVILADVNGLKLINDVFGHREGDRLLREVAGILRCSAREEDVLARIGGDEFAILVPQTTAEEAEDIMHRISARCRERNDASFTISVSFGVATKSAETEGVWEVFGRAEERMYQDKLLSRDSAKNAIIKSLRSALEEKTLETSEHMKRLEKLGVEVGRGLGLGESRLNNLALLAQLHDIGKVAVPASVLQKTEPLDATERAEIERHPEIGYRIAQTTVDLASISDAILSHHEWYNGEGYPRGLKGEAIPLLARILAVVDAYDAMTNDRPYCEPMDREAALAELQAQSGTQFDPDVVDAFLAVMEEREFRDDAAGLPGPSVG